jgi:hypothetical protein
MSKFTAAMNAVKERGSAAPIALEKLQASVETAPRPAGKRRRGRPAGKRSRETIVQVTAYVESAIYLEAKIQLLRKTEITGKKQDFSELVQQLLSEWLRREG